MTTLQALFGAFCTLLLGEGDSQSLLPVEPIARPTLPATNPSGKLLGSDQQRRCRSNPSAGKSLQKDENMNDVEIDDMMPEYDFSNAEQGKYAKHFEGEVTAILLDGDVAKVFPDGKQVNDILRALIPTVTKSRPIALP